MMERQFIYSYRGDWSFGRRPVSEEYIVSLIEKAEAVKAGEAALYKVYEIKPVNIMLTPVDRVVTDVKVRLEKGE